MYFTPVLSCISARRTGVFSFSETERGKVLCSSRLLINSFSCSVLIPQLTVIRAETFKQNYGFIFEFAECKLKVNKNITGIKQIRAEEIVNFESDIDHCVDLLRGGNTESNTVILVYERIAERFIVEKKLKCAHVKHGALGTP